MILPHLSPVRLPPATQFGALADSSASITASGNAVETLPQGGLATLGISAGLTVPPALQDAVPPYFTAFANVGAGKLSVEIRAPDAISDTGNTCSAPTSFDFEFEGPPDGLPLQLQLDDSYGFKFGDITGIIGSIGCPYGINGTGSWRFSWPTIVNSSPPDPTAAQ